MSNYVLKCSSATTVSGSIKNEITLHNGKIVFFWTLHHIGDSKCLLTVEWTDSFIFVVSDRCSFPPRKTRSQTADIWWSVDYPFENLQFVTLFYNGNCSMRIKPEVGNGFVLKKEGNLTPVSERKDVSLRYKNQFCWWINPQHVELNLFCSFFLVWNNAYTGLNIKPTDGQPRENGKCQDQKDDQVSVPKIAAKSGSWHEMCEQISRIDTLAVRIMKFGNRLFTFVGCMMAVVNFLSLPNAHISTMTSLN